MEFLDRVVKGSKTKLYEFRLSDKAKRNLSKANVPDISGAFESLRVANMIKNGVLQDSEMISRMIAYGENREKEQKALEFLESVEDDSSWEDDCSYEQIFEEFPVDIIAEIEKEL